MTETELNRQIEVSEQQRAELLAPQPKRRTGRAYRRMMNSCYIDSIPACAKGLTRDDMLSAKEAMLAMGIDIQDEEAVAGFAVSRKVLGMDRRKR